MKRAGHEATPGQRVEDSYFGEDPFQSFRRLLPTQPPAREPEPLLCRHLRGRAWSVIHPAVERPDSSEPFLCLKTLRRGGPDGARVTPDSCTVERGCFEPAHCSRESES
ncbi:MAG TPA: hypothetical protein VLG15_03520 [Thermoanaerobaculia bacterium]|nr:hypothetical protein [Thermoanaerobaculia bacterium]